MPHWDGAALPMCEVLGKSFSTLSDRPNPLLRVSRSERLVNRLDLVIVYPLGILVRYSVETDSTTLVAVVIVR
jgi:hypothetical protein